MSSTDGVGGASKRVLAAVKSAPRSTSQSVDSAPAKRAAKTRTGAAKTTATKTTATKTTATKTTAAKATAATKRAAAKKAPPVQPAPAKKASPAQRTTQASAPPAKASPAKPAAAKQGAAATSAKAPTKAPAKASAKASTTASTKATAAKTAAPTSTTAAPTSTTAPAARQQPVADKAASAPRGAPAALKVREDESPWTAAELAEVRTELVQDVERLSAEISTAESGLHELLRDSGDGAGDDQADAGAKTFEREQEISLANNSREMLEQSKRALAAIDDATYGICESCGLPVGKMRLQAFPRATLCVSCKSRQERR